MLNLTHEYASPNCSSDLNNKSHYKFSVHSQSRTNAVLFYQCHCLTRAYLASTVRTMLDSFKRMQKSANENPRCKLPRVCRYLWLRTCDHSLNKVTERLFKTALIPVEVKHHNLESWVQVITDARPMAFKDKIHLSEICWLLSLRACSLARAAERTLTWWSSVWPASDSGFAQENAC